MKKTNNTSILDALDNYEHGELSLLLVEKQFKVELKYKELLKTFCDVFGINRGYLEFTSNNVIEMNDKKWLLFTFLNGHTRTLYLIQIGKESMGEMTLGEPTASNMDEYITFMESEEELLYSTFDVLIKPTGYIENFKSAIDTKIKTGAELDVVSVETQNFIDKIWGENIYGRGYYG